ncbi:hypothetical protein B0H16DRAFT_1739489 [Mycena metata]|uniref:Thaumatin-like protein n=1 Tax=Mycena metata TaxID=1033252 RepID=A0AAD7MIU8_9AGAR|nr:hypothetical protein B0H16DRAFT_1739489 [Mycena metata]
MQLSTFHRLLLSTLLAIPSAKAFAVVLNNDCGFGTPTIVQNGQIVAVASTPGGDAVAFINPTFFPVEILGSRLTPFIQVSTDFFSECPGVGTICANASSCNTGDATCPGAADIGVTFCSDTI